MLLQNLIMQTGKNLVGSNKYQKQSEKSLSLLRQAAGAEPALPIGESLVFFLRTAVTGGKPPALGLLPHGMKALHAMS